jgi:hypothetical protein
VAQLKRVRELGFRDWLLWHGAKVRDGCNGFLVLWK